MKKEQNKRRKGGGRKFTDGNQSKAHFMYCARKWFLHEHSVKQFLHKYNLSRQSFYRFLDTHRLFKMELNKLRSDVIFYKKQNRRLLLQWLKDNPDKCLIDYCLRNLENVRFDSRIK